MSGISALLADDHESIKFGLRAIVESMPGWGVCGEASNGREAVSMAEMMHPAVVVMDINMPELNGLDATKLIRKRCPRTEVLIYTGIETNEVVQLAFEAGARSFIFKTQGIDRIIEALQSLSNHKPYFTQKVGEILFSEMLEKKQATTQGKHQQLSNREREIVQMLAEGRLNKEVASKLSISIKTVETHRSTIMRKLKLHTFSELIRYAVRNHIISP